MGLMDWNPTGKITIDGSTLLLNTKNYCVRPSTTICRVSCLCPRGCAARGKGRRSNAGILQNRSRRLRGICARCYGLTGIGYCEMCWRRGGTSFMRTSSRYLNEFGLVTVGAQCPPCAVHKPPCGRFLFSWCFCFSLSTFSVNPFVILKPLASLVRTHALSAVFLPRLSTVYRLTRVMVLEVNGPVTSEPHPASTAG